MSPSWWDILFPPTCVGCKKAGEWVCDACKKTIKFFHHPQESDFDSFIAVASYTNPVWQEVLKRFKYASARCLERDVIDILKIFRENYLDPWPWAGLDRLTIVPVASDPERVRSRGFDHAFAFAKHLHRQFVPWAELKPLLKRKRSSLPNAKLEEDHLRRANVADLFQVTEKIDGPVLLVDDVFTSGATMREAAKAVKEAGATQVHVFVMAKAPNIKKDQALDHNVAS